VTNLVTHPDDQEFYRIPVPDRLVGKPVSEALMVLKQEHDALLVAIVRGIDDYVLNPPMDRSLAADDHLLVISSYVRVGEPA
jgi:K+/H+ antiporter YhaU regulatory subunit KhtT